MWFLKVASGDKVSEFFPSQAKLAVHMQMSPQSLQKAIRKGKTVFQFHGQEVRVVQQRIPQFAVFDFPPSESPLETFELVAEAANWLKVPAQTVYAAIKRGKETKVKNKEGGVFWLKKLEEERVAPEEAPAPASELNFKIQNPPVPVPALQSSDPAPTLEDLNLKSRAPVLQKLPPASAPAPVLQKLPPASASGQEEGALLPVPAWLQNVPNLQQVLQLLQVLQNPELGQNLLLPLLQGTSPAVLEQKLALPPLAHEIPVEPPIPWAVAEVLKGGNNHPFFPQETFKLSLFSSSKTAAEFIKNGLRGKMSVQGAKTKKLMLWNDKVIYVPDLIKEIIVFYIRKKMFENEEATEFLVQIITDYTNNGMWYIKPSASAVPKYLGKVKRLKDEFIRDVTNDFMKLIF